MKIFTKLFLVNLLILISLQGWTQTKKHPIDIQYEKCLASKNGQTTAGMIGCAQKAYDLWDAELNKYYKLLINQLKADEKENLMKSQKSWIIYRDNEANFFDGVCINLEGTMYRPMAVNRQVEIVKQRTLELKSYCELLTKAR